MGFKHIGGVIMSTQRFTYEELKNAFTDNISSYVKLNNGDTLRIGESLVLIPDILDLIEYQQAEIEEYKAINESLKADRPFLVAIARNEVIKDFADRLKDDFCYSCSTHKKYHLEIEQCRAKENPQRKWCFKMRLIDNLVKEVVGDDE